MEKNYILNVALLSHRKVGAIVTFVDDHDGELRGRIVAIHDGLATVRAFDRLRLSTESPLDITLVQSLPSKEKMAFVIQKATELGVNQIIPCISVRSTQSAGYQGKQDKSHRWMAIAEKAAAQCRRRIIPAVLPLMTLNDVLATDADSDTAKFILYEKEPVFGFVNFPACTGSSRKVILVCGPEGGFTEDEIAFGRDMGFSPVRMGGRILRCETASIVALSIIQYMWGDL
jgi:16S rRNA (uracil1498-N3)-methyltransferase